MQHDLDMIRTAKATERREMAINLYDMACDAPEGADWRLWRKPCGCAFRTHGRRRQRSRSNWRRLPASRPTIRQRSTTSRQCVTWNPRASRSPLPMVRRSAQADGATKGRWNVGQAVRAAVELFRYKVCPGFAVSHIEVPEIVAIRNTLTGEEYDPAPANAETVEKRRAAVKAIRTPPAKQRERKMIRLGWFECPELYRAGSPDERRLRSRVAADRSARRSRSRAGVD